MTYRRCTITGRNSSWAWVSASYRDNRFMDDGSLRDGNCVG